MRDFTLPSQSKCNLCSSGLLRSVWWKFLTDVSGQLIGLNFKGQEIFLYFLTLENGTERVYQNVCKKLPPYAAQYNKRVQISLYITQTNK